MSHSKKINSYLCLVIYKKDTSKITHMSVINSKLRKIWLFIEHILKKKFKTKDTNNPPKNPFVNNDFLLMKYFFHCDPAFNKRSAWKWKSKDYILITQEKKFNIPINQVLQIYKTQIHRNLLILITLLSLPIKLPLMFDNIQR